MKWNCGPTPEERTAAAAIRRANEVARLSNWHDHFALIPRQVASHDCRWLETIQRKGELRTVYVDFTPTQCWRWEYRAKPLQATASQRGGCDE